MALSLEFYGISNLPCKVNWAVSVGNNKTFRINMNKPKKHHTAQVHHLNALLWDHLFPKFPQDYSQQTFFLHYRDLDYHPRWLTSSLLCPLFILFGQSCFQHPLKASYLSFSTVCLGGMSWLKLEGNLLLMLLQTFFRLIMLNERWTFLTHTSYVPWKSNQVALTLFFLLLACQVLEKRSNQHRPSSISYSQTTAISSVKKQCLQMPISFH